MDETLSIDELMKLCLRHFEDALRAAVMPPARIREEYEDYPGMAWELRQDLLSGAPLVAWPGLADRQRHLIADVDAAADGLGDQGARGEKWMELLHPSWEAVRGASHLYLSSMDKLSGK